MNRRHFLGMTGAAAGACLFPSCGKQAAPRAALGEADWRALAGGLAGDVLRPGEAGYDNARLAYNARFDSMRPLAVVRCGAAADAREAIAFARRLNLPVAPRGGGHSYAGYSTGGGLVIDVARLRTINTTADQATIGAGARLIDVYDQLTSRGVAIPAGSCPTVGIAGLTMGGGIGIFGRANGLTIDRLVSADVVTADGRILSCDAAHEPDLFWALRGGGGGNFGVVTSFTFRTHPTHDVGQASVEWKVDDAPAVLKGWQSWAAGLGDDVWSALIFSSDATAFTLSIAVYTMGGGGELAAQLGALTAAVGREPLSQTSNNRTYRDLLFYQAGCENTTASECHISGQTPDGKLPRYSFAGSSDIFERWLPSDGIQAIVQAMQRRHEQGRTGMLLFELMGGAINRVVPDATAFVHRASLFLVQYFSRFAVGTADGVVAEAAAWQTQMRALMSPWSNGHAYQNYIDPAITDWKAAYYGSNYPRLQRVKAAYDPDGLFRFPQGIPPS